MPGLPRSRLRCRYALRLTYSCATIAFIVPPNRLGRSGWRRLNRAEPCAVRGSVLTLVVDASTTSLGRRRRERRSTRAPEPRPRS